MASFAGSGLSLGTLYVNIAANVADAAKTLQKFGDDQGKLVAGIKKDWDGLSSVGAQFSKLGATLTAAITIPLAAIAAGSISMAADFQSSMNKIQAVTDATAGEMTQMHDVAIKLGQDTQFSAKQAADGMAELGQAGFSTEQIIGAMPGTLNLAAAGALAISRAAEVTTATLGQFGLAAGDAGRVADVFAKAAGASNATVEDLAQSMKLVGPVAHDVGMSLETTTAALATLSQGGLKATEAGTGLRGVIASLEAPSKKAQTVLDELGITTEDTSGKMLPLDNIMKQLKDSGATTADMFRIFGRESASAADILKNNTPTWQTMTKEIDNASGAAEKMAATLRAGVAGDFEQLKGSVETAGIALGEVLAPAIASIIKSGTTFVNWLVDVIKAFGQLPGPVKAAVEIFVALAAAIGPVLFALGKLPAAFSAVQAGVTVVNGLLGSAGLAGALTTLGPLAIAAGIALAGWGLYKLIADLRETTAELNHMSDALARGEGASKDQAERIRVLEQVLAKNNVTVDRAGLSVAEYTKKLEDNAKQVLKADDSTKGFGKTFSDVQFTLDKGVVTVKKLNDEQKKTPPIVKKAADSHKAAAKEIKAQTEALARVTDASELYAAMAQKLTGLHKAYIDRQAEVALGLDKTTQNTKALLTPLDELSDKFTGVADSAKATQTQIDAASAAIDKITTGANQAQAPVYGLQDALHQFGIKSTADYDALANEAHKAYDAVMGDPNSTDFERDNMMLKMLIAQRDQMRANSEEIPQSMQDTIDALNNEVSGSNGLKKTQGFFEDFGNSVSTVFTNFAQDISKTLWEGGDSWGEKGKKLLTSLGEAVTSAFLEPAAKAIAKFITGALADLLGEAGFAGILSSLKKLGEAIINVFSGASKAAGDVAGAAGDAAGAAGSAGAGAAGAAGAAAGAGLAGIVSAVSGVVSAISGVISNFQMAGINKSLDVIVNHTLRTFNELFQFRKDAWDRWGGWMQIKDDILNRLNTIMDNSNLASLQFQDVIHDLNSVADNAAHAAVALDGIQTSMDGSVERESAYFDRLINGLERVATATERALTVNLNGTDPDVVAARVMQRLRLQGGTA